MNTPREYPGIHLPKTRFDSIEYYTPRPAKRSRASWVAACVFVLITLYCLWGTWSRP